YLVIGQESRGVKIIEDMLKQLDDSKRSHMRIQGDQIIAIIGGQELPATLRLNPAKSPPEIDIVSNANKKKVDYGIYKLDGDMLTFCLAVEGSELKDRPTEFKATSKTSIMILRKQLAR